MRSFTEEILALAREILPDEFIWPPDHVSPDDKVLGQMSEFHLQLFTLWQRFAREAETLGAVVRHPQNSKEREENSSTWMKMIRMTEMAEQMFWYEAAQGSQYENTLLTLKSGGEIVHARLLSSSPFPAILYVPVYMGIEDQDPDAE
ncbi:MAG: hypothetical protein Q7S63_01170 [bacterium]|nr:hypothetical protein [bacterium]